MICGEMNSSEINLGLSLVLIYSLSIGILFNDFGYALKFGKDPTTPFFKIHIWDGDPNSTKIYPGWDKLVSIVDAILWMVLLVKFLKRGRLDKIP